jgi:hypothetical protein
MENFSTYWAIYIKKRKIRPYISMFESYILLWWNIVVLNMKNNFKFNPHPNLKLMAQVRELLGYHQKLAVSY